MDSFLFLFSNKPRHIYVAYSSKNFLFGSGDTSVIFPRHIFSPIPVNRNNLNRFKRFSEHKKYVNYQIHIHLLKKN